MAYGTPDSSLRLGQRLLPLEPQFRERVWGGQLLRAADPPIGEAWVAFGDSVVASGPRAGRKLTDLTAEHGAELLGSAVHLRYGRRFPLLAKILDCADWLSVQVHPNDEQARRMVGPDEFGKTEAWFFLTAAPDARILLGVRAGTTPAELASAIRGGRVAEVAEQVPVRSHEAVLIPAGTLHALGPGLLLYEIQQQSDTTYRAYDWGRPQTTGRKLHIEESVEVTTTDVPSRPKSVVTGTPGSADAVECAFFDLDLVRAVADPLDLDTGGGSFHLLTTIEGAAEILAGDELVRLERFETVLVAGAAGAYRVRSAAGSAAGSTALMRVAVPV